MSSYLWQYASDVSRSRRCYHQRAVMYEGIGAIPNQHYKKTRHWAEKPATVLKKHLPTTAFEHLLTKRRTVRHPSEKDVTMAFLERLLQFAVGASDEAHPLMTYPSPGATYPTQVFLATPFSESAYRYNPFNHTLECFDVSGEQRLRRVVGDPALKPFPLFIFLASDYQLVEEKYGAMAYRLLNQEMGHMAQNISLYATQEGFHSVCVGGFYQSYFKAVVGDAFDLHYVVVVG